MEEIQTTKGKPSLILDGYRYRLHRTTKENIRHWRCTKQRSERCSGQMKTTSANDVLESAPHQCKPNIAEVEVEKTKFICRKRIKKDTTVPVSQIYKQEFSKILDKGLGIVTEVTPYTNMKSSLCKIRRETLGTAQNPKTSSEIELNEDLLTMSDKSSFLLFDETYGGKRALGFSSAEGKNILKTNEEFFVDGTFKSCPMQFKQVFTIHAAIGSSDEVTNVLPVAYLLLENKTKSTYVKVFSTMKRMGWSPKKIKIDFGAALQEALNDVFPEADLSGCICSSGEPPS